MEDIQRRSQRPRARREDPDFVPIADIDMPGRNSTGFGFTAAVAASLASSRIETNALIARERAFTSLNSHASYSKAHHLDPTPFTRQLGLLPSCKRRRTVCEVAAAAALGQHHQLGQLWHDASVKPDQTQPCLPSRGQAANAGPGPSERTGGRGAEREKLSQGKRALQDISDQSSSDQLLMMSKQHAAAYPVKSEQLQPELKAAPSSQKKQRGYLQKAADRMGIAQRAFRRKGTPHRSSAF